MKTEGPGATMHTDTFCRHLVTVITAVAEEQRLEVLANELALFFGVQPHEIGLFHFDSEGRYALFVWPPHQLPQDIKLSANSLASSLVSTTAWKRRGSINNTFATTPHVHMFEHSLIERGHRIPLQKVMAAPCLDGERLRWVIQVSRKGRTLEEAGPDFTPAQLQALETLSGTVATLPL